MTELVRRDADQRDVAVVKSAQYLCDDKRLVDGRRTCRTTPRRYNNKPLSAVIDFTLIGMNLKDYGRNAAHVP